MNLRLILSIEFLNFMRNKISQIYSETEDRQRSYYNEIAIEYDVHKGSTNYAFSYRKMWLDQIFKGINLKNMKTLDAMCGGGQFTGYLVKMGTEVTGLDISEKCCRIYKARFPGCKIVCGSILQTPFENDTFDLVVTDSLHHLYPYVDECITEILRILKPNGYLLMWEPSSGSIFDIARKIWYKIDPKYFEQNEKSIDCDLLKKDIVQQ